MLSDLPRLTPEFIRTARGVATSWGGALALHLVLALIAFVLVPSVPPPQRAPETLIVELITPEPPVEEEEEPPPEPETAEETNEPPAAEDVGQTAQANEAPPIEFEFELPPPPWPDVLRQAERAPGADAVAPGLPSGMQGMFRTVMYCSASAQGLAAELARCPRWLDNPKFAARAAALEAMFWNPDFVAAAQARDAGPRGPATPLAESYDRRLGAASEMRDSLPPSAPDPAFGD